VANIPTFENFNHNTTLVNETYEILEGQVSHDELTEILNEGIFSFIKGIFSNPKKKRELDKLGEELFKLKVKLQKIQIEEDQIDVFKDEVKSKGNDYTSTKSKIDIADKAKAAKIQALRKKEEITISKMDAIGEGNDKLTKYVNKVKLEIRIRANDAIIKLADDEIARVLKQMQKKDAKEIKILDKELAKAA
tara:strand:+ start:2529 stop:3104 length:576 start_codon:yes stop_codon:yes gene_type:complete